MADEQLKQQKIAKNKAIGKEIKKNIVNAPIKQNDKKIEKELIKKEENKTEEVKVESEKKEGEKIDEKKSEKKAVPKTKKTEAIIYGRNIPISLKHAVAIGKFIKNCRIDEAISNLEKVKKKKLAIPFKGEIAHKKGKRLDRKDMTSGKYPVKSSQNIIQLLKTLKANSAVNGLDIEKTKIIEVIPNKASKQLHRFGSTRFKRIHIMIKAKEVERGGIN